MQVSLTNSAPEALLTPRKTDESTASLSKTERRFLGLFWKSIAVFTLLAMILTVRQMGQAIEFSSLMWALVSNGSVGAAMGMLFALAHDVIIKGRLEE
ncbi:MAG: hypothetical protein K2X77_08335 [Candidatus Obscuribacterales bacterium]|nr:hypothetical protein [Candidatus Obscuribacterales bacterium]